jgi:hypothetical protein
VLQDDNDTPECLKLLEQVGLLEFRSVSPGYGCHKAAKDLSRACPVCLTELELQIFHTGPGGAPTRWPYCPRCNSKRFRALSKEDAIKFIEKETIKL